MLRFAAQVLLYVAVVIALAVGAAYALAIEHRQILVGKHTATYYDGYGAVIGRTKLSGNTINIYNRSGSYDGKIELGSTTRIYDRNGSQIGRASGGSRISLYNRNGAFDGSITIGSTSRFQDVAGKADGWATSSGRTTTFYNSNGRQVGKKQ